MLVTETTFQPLTENNPMLIHYRTLFHDGDPTKNLFYQLADGAKSPRTIKTHLPFSLLPPTLLDTCKVRTNLLYACQYIHV